MNESRTSAISVFVYSRRIRLGRATESSLRSRYALAARISETHSSRRQSGCLPSAICFLLSAAALMRYPTVCDLARHADQTLVPGNAESHVISVDRGEKRGREAHRTGS